jgi:hypothetical protein
MKRLILVSLLVLILIPFLWVALRPQPTIVLQGTLSAQDIDDVKSAVNREMRAELFSRISFANIKYLPINLIYCAQYNIVNIQVAQPNFVCVYLKKNHDGIESSYTYCDVKSGTNGWVASKMIPAPFK